MQSEVCDEIIFLLKNFNGATVEVWEWISKSGYCAQLQHILSQKESRTD